MSLIVSCLIVVLPQVGSTLLGQAPADSTRKLDAFFLFQDGVYFSLDALVENRADLGWRGIEGEMVELPASNRVQIAGLGYNEYWTEAEPYAIVLEGRPYILTKIDSTLGYHEFSRLLELGAIAYYEYQELVRHGRMMYAYNPVNGRPFREAYVERERLEWQRRCIDWQTGRTFELNRANLLEPLSEESDLIYAISNLEADSPDFYSYLCQAVVRYNERHPIQLPIRQ